MNDNSRELIPSGAAMFLIGVIGLISPIIPDTFAKILKRDTVEVQVFFVFLVILGAVLFYLGIRSRS